VADDGGGCAGTEVVKDCDPPVSIDGAPSALHLERERYRRAQSVRSVLTAAASTCLLGVVMFFVVVRSSGWGRVHRAFFSGHYGGKYFGDIMRGLWLNVRMVFFCEIAILVLGLAIALARTLRGPIFFPVRALAAIYTDVFRGMPLIVLLYIIGFGVPGLEVAGVPKSAAILGGIAIVLTYSAYVAEVFRAGIQSVHPSQRAASRSLGLSYSQTMRFVVVPQAVRRVLPPLLNDFVALQKDTGLISVLGAVDAVRAAQIGVYRDFNYTPYVVAGVIFVLFAIPFIRLGDWVAARDERRRGQGGVT